MSQLIAALDAYYRAEGIHSQAFHCKHHGVCDPAAQATASLVGEYYESARALSIPRIVFVSLDPGRMRQSDERTLESERERERDPNTDHGKLKKGLHWSETHELAMAMLQPWVPDVRFDTACHYFAHVRVVRCSANLQGKAQAPKRMSRHCREYLQRELEILEPDVIVSQGAVARGVMAHIVSESTATAKKDCGCRIGILAGREVLLIATHHPSPRARRYYRPQKEACWTVWVDEVRRFMLTDRRLSPRGE